MRSKKFRLFTLVLALVFLVTAFAGCGKGKDAEVSAESTKTVATESTQQATPEPEKNYEITKVVFLGDSAYTEDKTRLEKELEQKFNVTLKRVGAPAETYMTKVTSLIASGQAPDVWLLQNINDMVKMSNDGTIANLKDAITPTDFPVLDKEVKNATYAPYVSYKGGIWGIPNINTYTSAPWVPIIRKDWLTELNLKMPETLDELYNVAKVFKDKKKIYPIGACEGLAYDNLNFIMGAFGVVEGSWYTEGDKVVSYDVSPKMKEALAYLRKLKEEKLLDPDWSTSKEDVMFDKLISSKTGILQTWSVAHWRKDWNITEAQLRKDGTLKKDEKFDESKYYANENTTYLEYLPALKGPDGEVHGVRGLSPVFDRWVVSSKAAEDKGKLARILKLLDYTHSEEGWLHVAKGWKGETYDFDANGFVTWLPGKTNDDRRLMGIEYWQQGNGIVCLENEKLEPPGDVDKPYDMKIRKFSRSLPVLERLQDYLISDTWGKKQAEIDTKRREYFYKIINGTLPIDAFDKWIEEFKTMGYDQIAGEFTQAYADSK